MIPASVASVGSAPGHAMMFSHCSALGTVGHAVREPALRDRLKANVIGRELLIELHHRVAKFFRDGLSAVHVNTVP